jgi:hypothetical protein
MEALPPASDLLRTCPCTSKSCNIKRYQMQAAAETNPDRDFSSSQAGRIRLAAGNLEVKFAI